MGHEFHEFTKHYSFSKPYNCLDVPLYGRFNHFNS
jgi:hypothetical protein